MVSLKSIVWGIGLACMFGVIALFVNKKVGDAAGDGTYASNWASDASYEFTNNTSLIGLALVLGIIGAVLGYIRFFRK